MNVEGACSARLGTSFTVTRFPVDTGIVRSSSDLSRDMQQGANDARAKYARHFRLGFGVQSTCRAVVDGVHVWLQAAAECVDEG